MHVRVPARFRRVAACSIAVCVAVTGVVASPAAAQAKPRIVKAFGVLAGAPTTTYSAVRYCDASERPARFRVVFRIFNGKGQRIGIRTVTRRIAIRCDELLFTPVRTGSQIGRSIRVEVTNLRTGRSAVGRGDVRST